MNRDNVALWFAALAAGILLWVSGVAIGRVTAPPCAPPADDARRCILVEAGNITIDVIALPSLGVAKVPKKTREVADVRSQALSALP